MFMYFRTLRINHPIIILGKRLIKRTVQVSRGIADLQKSHKTIHMKNYLHIFQKNISNMKMASPF